MFLIFSVWINWSKPLCIQLQFPLYYTTWKRKHIYRTIFYSFKGNKFSKSPKTPKVIIMVDFRSSFFALFLTAVKRWLDCRGNGNFKRTEYKQRGYISFSPFSREGREGSSTWQLWWRAEGALTRKPGDRFGIRILSIRKIIHSWYHEFSLLACHLHTCFST